MARKVVLMRSFTVVAETFVRLLLKITCVAVRFLVATLARRNAGDRVGVVVFAAITIGCFLALRPVAYRLYPELRRSDLRRLKRGPNRTTLAALAVLIAIISAFVVNVLCGVALLGAIAAGGVFAVLITIRTSHEKSNLSGQPLFPNS